MIANKFKEILTNSELVDVVLNITDADFVVIFEMADMKNSNVSDVLSTFLTVFLTSGTFGEKLFDLKDEMYTKLRGLERVNSIKIHLTKEAWDKAMAVNRWKLSIDETLYSFFILGLNDYLEFKENMFNAENGYA